jgi:hypothetical protein
MNDKELLELAAKAAGYRVNLSPESGSFWLSIDGGRSWTEWNPLTDDGDALRLAVKLGLCIDTASQCHWGMTTYISDFRCKQQGLTGYGSETHGIDPYAATRRAIVKAAAQIGKDMK